MTDVRENFSDLLRDLLEDGDDFKIVAHLEGVHPADLALALSHLDADEALRVFQLLDEEASSEILAEADEDLRSRLTERIPDQELSELLEEMDPDDAADLVGDIEDAERQQRILSLMSEVERAEVEDLLSHHEETAGGIMTSEYLAFPESWTVQNTRTFLAQAPPETPFTMAYTIDDHGRFLGGFPIQELIWRPANERLATLTDREFPRVSADTDQEEVARLFTRYDLISIPVVDEDGRLAGRITVDDILDVVSEETSEDMFRMAGSSEDELFTRSAWGVLRFRLPWLLVALLGGIVCAFILGRFEYELSRFTYLAFYLPVIMTMGGNIGNQSSTLIVRGIATGHLDSGRIFRVIWKEVRVAILMGTFCGFLVALFSSTFAFLKGDPTAIGLIVGLSMTVSMMIAGLFASIVPLTFSKLGIDPAVASGPFITMSNDGLGIIVYFTITQFFHPWLIGG
ncbi:MAG: magnesium transporter [Candidatus Omnitrophica bacterium]|nr:magnesium transporter [Candidatus Omnitrophota bacterium]MCB9766664.1 magnesium transporter [Candidatus Omnitrophota bacterium]MCB9783713.1 magnesium transporter [Candidatus Omnitrophota bacterium]